jgi:hypothetical protein
MHGRMCPVQDGIVKLHARLTATHALNGLAASVWDRATGLLIGVCFSGGRLHQDHRGKTDLPSLFSVAFETNC